MNEQNEQPSQHRPSPVLLAAVLVTVFGATVTGGFLEKLFSEDGPGRSHYGFIACGLLLTTIGLLLLVREKRKRK